MTLSRTSWLVLGLVLIALIVRLAGAAASFDRPLSFDPQDYDRIARSIVATGGYPGAVTPRGGPSAFRPPAYPVLLALLYDLTGHIQKPAPFAKYFAPGYHPPAKQVNAGLVLQALLGTLAVALTGLVALMLWGRSSAVWTVAIATVYLPLILIGFQLYSEPLFVVWELAAVVCALRARSSTGARKRWAFGAGVMVGLAWLTRSNGFLLLPPVLVLVWVDRPRFSRGTLGTPAVTLLATLLTIAPWTVRNVEVMHAFVPVSDENGYTLAGTYNDTARRDGQYLGGWIPAQNDPLNKRLILASRGELDEGHRLQNAAVGVIEDHPLYVAQAGFCNAARLVYLGLICGDNTFAITASYRVEDGASRTAALVTVAEFAVAAILGLVGLTTRAARSAPWALWSIPVVLATIAFIEGGNRFRAPIDPFLILAAAVGARCAWARVWRERSAQTEPHG